jgi:propanol-preferring alcohol dehydrogenase
MVSSAHFHSIDSHSTTPQLRNSTPLEQLHAITMGSVPTEQWAQVIEKTGGPVEYKKIPVQKPGPDEVLVNIKYSGVCHTDLHAVNGDWPLVSQS